MTDQKNSQADRRISFWPIGLLWFLLSLLLASILWTVFFERIFSDGAGPELAITWQVSVFGSAFISGLLALRKMEYFNSLSLGGRSHFINAWFLGIGVFTSALVLSCLYWTFTMRETIFLESLDREWTRKVFLTWLFLLVPFLIYMYTVAIKIFGKAVKK